MMETKIKCGDKVTLKSGGPVMTVSKVSPRMFNRRDEIDVSCTWFDAYKRVHHKDFDPDELDLCVPKEEVDKGMIDSANELLKKLRLPTPTKD